MEKDIINAHVCCKNNKDKLLKVENCGCCYCLKIFSPDLIREWCDDGNTAICPFCGIDAIIYENKYYPLSRKFLEKMKKYWF